jgi:hypothetical protein
VLALEPRAARPAARHRALFERLAARRRIRSVPVAGLDALSPPEPGDFVRLEMSPVATLAQALAARLGWQAGGEPGRQ